MHKAHLQATASRAVLVAETIRLLGGRGSGNWNHLGRPGAKGGSGDGGSDKDKTRNERSKRALAAHTPFTKEKETWATGNERLVVSMVKGQGTDNNRPVDVVVKVDGKVKGIEVKTMLENKSNQITMRSEAQERKLAWARSNHASLHTVVIDDRKAFGKAELHSGHQIYYKRGVGSFRLDAMTKVQNAAHLTRLLSGAKK